MVEGRNHHLVVNRENPVGNAVENDLTMVISPIFACPHNRISPNVTRGPNLHPFGFVFGSLCILYCIPPFTVNPNKNLNFI
jgi:hypothetical protein